MAYFIRFLSLDPLPLSLDILEQALKAVDPNYNLKRSAYNREIGELKYGRGLYALMDLEHVDGDSCPYLNELRAELHEVQFESSRRILERLDTVTDVLTLELKWMSRGSEKTLSMLDPLWDWLLEHRTGFIHADGEGLYEGRKLVLELGVKLPHTRQGPPCSHCGAPLRSEKAQQCFNCGADWHSRQ